MDTIAVTILVIPRKKVHNPHNAKKRKGVKITSSNVFCGKHKSPVLKSKSADYVTNCYDRQNH